MTEIKTLHNLHTIDIDVGEQGLTVRRSKKWHNVKEGDIIYLCECLGECNIVGTGIVTESVWFGNFKDIPARLLEIEHGRNCRNYTGLLKAMEKGYPDFSEQDVVTAFSYRRIN